jgi:hypothetical protein
MTITPGRIVAILTPLVFAPLAGSIAVLAARYFPGVDIDQGRLQAIFIAGATIAFGKAAIWLKGWQDWEKREADVAGAEVDLPTHEGDDVVDLAEDDMDVAGEDADFDDGGFEDGDPGFDEADLDDLLGEPVATGSED